MGFIDTIFGGGKGAAGDDMAAGYDRANAYLAPYQQGGLQDYNKYRDVINKYGTDLDKYGNPMDWMWQQASKDPTQFYQDLMKGYNETPQAKYEQEQAMKGATQGAAASGTLGSGALFKALQQNASDITGRDQDRYLNNILGVNNQQMQYGQNLQGERANYRNGLWGLTNLGFNAATGMGQNEIGKGQGQAYGDEGRAQGWQDLIGAGLNLLW